MKKIRKETMEKLTRMARCLSEGKTVRACLKEVGISSDTYSRYKSLIWDMVKTMKKSEGKEEEKKEEEILPSVLEQQDLTLNGELKEATEALEKTVAFLDKVERIKRQLASKLAMPPSPFVHSFEEEREEEEGEKEKPVITNPFAVLKNAQELLNQAKSFLESFGYLVVPPHERHRWYHEEEVKELIKKKLEEKGSGVNTISGEQLQAVERIVTKIIDRIGSIFEKALSVSPEEEEKRKLIQEIMEEVEEGESKA